MDDRRLADVAAKLATAGGRIGLRRIRDGDEIAVAPSPAFATPARRRASGAARLAARALIADLGLDASCALARSESGAPNWPPGLIGSLAHDELFALAAVAPKGPLIGLGVDIEAAEPLPGDVVDFVLHGDERRYAAEIDGRLIFAAKEAVYKAIFPLDATALEYADIAVDLDAGRATLADGRRLVLFCARAERLIVVAAFGGPACVSPRR